MKTIETVPRRSFISGLLPQECKYCIPGECNNLKHHLQDAGIHKHVLEKESCGNFETIEEVDGVPKGATSSFNSPPHEGNKDERKRYKSCSNHIPFDYVKHDKFPHKYGKRIACSFCGLNNHNASRCWKRMATYKNLLKERKQEAKCPLDKENHVVKWIHM